MGISRLIDLPKDAFQKLDIFIQPIWNHHPIAVIAIAILFPLAVISLCVWGARKAYLAKATEKEKKINQKALEVLQDQENRKNHLYAALATGALFTVGAVFSLYLFSSLSKNFGDQVLAASGNLPKSEIKIPTPKINLKPSIPTGIAVNPPGPGLTLGANLIHTSTHLSFGDKAPFTAGEVFNSEILKNTNNSYPLVNSSVNSTTQPLNFIAENIADYTLPYEVKAVGATMLGVYALYKLGLSAINKILPAKDVPDQFEVHPLMPKDGILDPQILRDKIQDFKNQSDYFLSTKGKSTFKTTGVDGKLILSLEGHAQIARNKAWFLEAGLNALGNQLSNIKTLIFANPEKYVLTSLKAPAYFNSVISKEMIDAVKVSVTPQFYDFQHHASKWDVFFNYANKVLGGGWNNHGFVMEEAWVFMCPAFATLLSYLKSIFPNGEDYSAKNWIETRTGAKVMEGSPTPAYIEGLENILDIPTHPNDNRGSVYGLDNLSKVDERALGKRTSTLPKPVKVNMIALAAPNLKFRNSYGKFDVQTLKDLLNTITAGTNLAKMAAQQNGKEVLVHSGKLGAGDFGNSPHAVYLLHLLTSAYTGAEMKLYGYTKKESDTCKQLWAAVAPQLAGNTLEENVKIISNHLKKNNP